MTPLSDDQLRALTDEEICEHFWATFLPDATPGAPMADPDDIREHKQFADEVLRRGIECGP